MRKTYATVAVVLILSAGLALLGERSAAPHSAVEQGLAKQPARLQVESHEDLRSEERSASPDVPLAGSDSTVTYQVSFPDGEQIPITLRAMPFVQAELLSSVTGAYDALASAANAGDGIAAYTLAENLRSCYFDAFQSAEALQQAIDDLASTHSYASPLGHPVGVSPNMDGFVDVQQHAAYLVATYERCRGVSRSRSASWKDWYIKSAESGVLMGALNWANAASKRSSDKLHAHQRLWTLGSRVGLGAISVAYQEGWGELEPDPVKAYAYGLLHMALLRSVYTKPNGVVSSYYWTRWEERPPEQLAKSLTHAQAAEAVGLAKRVLRENANCCVRM